MNLNVNRLVQTGILLGFPFILNACASTTIRQHPEYKVRLESSKTAMLVPPYSQVILKFSQGSKQFPEEAEKVVKDLGDLVASELTQRGFAVKSVNRHRTLTRHRRLG